MHRSTPSYYRVCTPRTPWLRWLLALTLLAGASCLRTAGSRQIQDGEDGDLDDVGGPVESFIQNVACANHTREDSATWAAYQRSLTAGLERMFGEGPHKLRILVASAVRDSPDTVANFEDNLRRLRREARRDVFHFALFHHDNSSKFWDQSPDAQKVVVLKHLGPGCKPQFWFQIPPSLAARYHYIWLLDGDMRLDLFSWGLYRTLLGALQPLVTQPSILPWAHGERDTLIPALRMTARKHGAFTIAREVYRSEVQAPFISSKLWPALHARLRGNDRTTDNYVDNFWDAGATLSKLECGLTAVLLVNGSPLRHMNYHDLWHARNSSGKRLCFSGCGVGDANCRGVTEEELGLIREGLRDVCQIGANSSFLQQCEAGLPCHTPLDMHKWRWVETGGGNVSRIEASSPQGPGATCRRMAYEQEQAEEGGAVVP